MTELTTASESAKINLHQDLLELSKCRNVSPTRVTCDEPGFGAGAADFSTFSSLGTLYDAYVARIKTLNGGVMPNGGNCNKISSEGEISWNHHFQHLARFTLNDLRAGGLNPVTQAAGRIFCTYQNGALIMVWTQNNGMLLGEVNGAGSPVSYQHEDTWYWWLNMHHRIPGTSAMNDMPH